MGARTSAPGEISHTPLAPRKNHQHHGEGVKTLVRGLKRCKALADPGLPLPRQPPLPRGLGSVRTNRALDSAFHRAAAETGGVLHAARAAAEGQMRR